MLESIGHRTSYLFVISDAVVTGIVQNAVKFNLILYSLFIEGVSISGRYMAEWWHISTYS
jgi:hypothetical protein